MVREQDYGGEGSDSRVGQRVRVLVNIFFVLLLMGSAAPVFYFMNLKPARDPDKVHLRFMVWGGPVQLNQAQDVVDAFLAQPGNENIEVELLGMSLRYHSKLAAMMSSHDAPDVFLIAPVHIPKYADREDPVIQDITDLVLRDREEMDFDDIDMDAVQSFYCNGRLFGLPRDYKTTGMAYNADMLAAAGLEDPNALFARNEWTWEKLLEYLEILMQRDEDGAVKVFGLFQDSFSEGYWHNILLQAGGGIWSDDGHELIVDKPESIRGLQFVRDLAWKYRVAKPWTPEMGTDDPWVARQTAMMGFRGWHVSRYIRDTYNENTRKFRYPWDVCPWPLGPQIEGEPEAIAGADGRPGGYRLPSGRIVTPGTIHFEKTGEGKPAYRLLGCTATGIGYSMSKDTVNREAAWKLQKFLVSTEAQIIRAKFQLTYDGVTYEIPGPNMPSRSKAVPAYMDMALPPGHTLRPTFEGSLAGKNQQARWPSIDLFIDARKYGRPAVGALGQDFIDRELARQVQRMMLEKDYTPEQVVRATREAAEKEYRRLRESPFRNSYNDPSLIRPAAEDPLGLAPKH